MNKFFATGRAVADTEKKDIGTTIVANYRLAIPRRRYKGNQESDFIDCKCFGKQAEFAEKYIKKGTKILIEGSLQIDTYEKDGRKVYRPVIIVENHEFCESKKSGAAQPASASEAIPAEDDAPLTAEPDSFDSSTGFMDVGADEELPFI